VNAELYEDHILKWIGEYEILLRRRTFYAKNEQGSSALRGLVQPVLILLVGDGSWIRESPKGPVIAIFERTSGRAL
jgi:hypothetical protein